MMLKKRPYLKILLTTMLTNSALLFYSRLFFSLTHVSAGVFDDNSSSKKREKA
jgi:hypothetical protein